MKSGDLSAKSAQLLAGVRLQLMCRLAISLIVLVAAILHSSAEMALLFPIELSDRDKLEILQRLDRFRKWRSLDDKRYCLCCCALITGREIDVVGGTRGTGPRRVICPTPRCHAIPMDWVLPTDEVLEKMSMLQDEPPVNAIPTDRWGRRENAFTTALPRFAAQFRRVA